MTTLKSAQKILRAEKAAILAADFEQLALLEPDKTQLVAALAHMMRADLQVILTQLAENQRLLASAASGIASAKQRISELQAATAELNVYSANGQIEHVSTHSGAKSWRA